MKVPYFVGLLFLIVFTFFGCKKNPDMGKRTIHWYIPIQFPFSQEDSLNIFSHLNKEMGVSVHWLRFNEPLNVSSIIKDSVHLLTLPAVEGMIWMDREENPYVPIVLPILNTQSYQHAGRFQIACSVPKDDSVQNLLDASIDTLYIYEPKNILFAEFQRTLNRVSVHTNKPIRFLVYPNRERSKLFDASVGIVYKQYTSSDTIPDRKVIYQSKPIPEWMVLVSSGGSEEMKISLQNALMNVPMKHSLPYHIGKFVSCKMYDFEPLRSLIRNDTTFVIER